MSISVEELGVRTLVFPSSKLTIFRIVYADIFLLFKNSACSFTVPDKFLNGQKLARILLSITRDSRNWVRFCTKKLARFQPDQQFWQVKSTVPPLRGLLYTPQPCKCLHSLCSQSLEPSNEPLTKRPTPKLRLEKMWDQFRFLRNYPPTPPLSQHFALSEKC